MVVAAASPASGLAETFVCCRAVFVSGRRVRLLLAGSVAAALLVMPATGTAAPAPPVPAAVELVVLSATQAARTLPEPSAGIVTLLQAARPITGQPTTIPVLARLTDRLGRTWLQVRLPGRTLGHRLPPSSAWITAARTRPAAATWHLVVSRATRRLTVYHDGRAVRRMPVIVGAPATPTPAGEFFVEENVRLPADRVGAPYALATSARSRVLQEFDGGPGQIALHGRGHVGGTLGTAASHGCIRLDTYSITWLAARIGAGVPITIR